MNEPFSCGESNRRVNVGIGGVSIISGLICLSAVTGVLHASSAAPNILFFGNSFTQAYSPKDITVLLRDIHTAAGRASGTYYRRTTSGYSFAAHLANTGSESVSYLATQTLPAGQTWDYVVLQGNSIESTVTMGNRQAFLQNGKAIFDTILQSNPGAKAVAYETWARHANITGFYPTPFANPAAMQAEIEASYRMLVQNLNATNGVGSARYAGAGDAFKLQDFATALYSNDYYHASNRGELLIALTLYGALHGPTTTQLAASGALDAVASSIGVRSADVVPLAMVADAAGAPPGDTDLDWDVDFDDLLTLAQNYGQTSAPGSPANWFAGDFDASGTIDFDDLLSLAQRYSAALPMLQQSDAFGSDFAADWALARSVLPEPASLGMLGTAGILLMRRRR